MGHGQEEEVEGVKLALAGVQAFFQGCDRLGKLAGTVEGDTQGVEANCFPGASATANAASRVASTGSRWGLGPVASSQARLLMDWSRFEDRATVSGSV